MKPSDICKTCQTCGKTPAKRLRRMGEEHVDADYVVALAGNPNTGKSTVFNSLTGLRQHTGNWPGKTVAQAEGTFEYGQHRFRIVDLPGTYSLLATSYDEEVARDFLLFGQPDVTVVVVDATRLERNLNLALQVMEITDRVILCVNLIDEAERHGLIVDTELLAEELGIPVVAASARFGRGIDKLLETIDGVISGQIPCRPLRVGGKTPQLSKAVQDLTQSLRQAFPHLSNLDWISLRLLDGDERMSRAIQTGELRQLKSQRAINTEMEANLEQGASPSAPTDPVDMHREILEKASEWRWQVGPEFHQTLVEAIYAHAGRIADRVVRKREGVTSTWDERLDRIVTSPIWGFPIMAGLFLLVIWLTVQGANYPSQMLSWLLVETIHPVLRSLAMSVHLPGWVIGLVIDGGYLATAWVVSVMLPPMAIFFPMFTLLEDLGYLPRVAFNLDRLFRWAGAHGKQALTMSMGFGCNAAGVVACRIIDSPRERLVAILTNNFSLCNGRWPTQILLATIFLGSLVPSYLAGIVAAAGVISVASLGVVMALIMSRLLTTTVLKGEPSTFHLELPPYRPPQILQTLYRSLVDRTIVVLWRAVVFAFPAGLAIWLVANVHIGSEALAATLVRFLDPIGLAVGLNGIIVLAYIIAIPANEIVIPTVLMLTVLLGGMTVTNAQAGVLFEPQDLAATGEILRQAGWTPLTAICLMLFSLMHNPCSTTIYTIYAETKSVKWTTVSVLMPLLLGFAACLIVNQIGKHLLGF
ncbi:MAG: ferrous iron transport protein B [Thermogutta sp.]